MDEYLGREDGGMIVMRGSRHGTPGLVLFDRALAVSFDFGWPGWVGQPWPACGHGESGGRCRDPPLPAPDCARPVANAKNPRMGGRLA